MLTPTHPRPWKSLRKPTWKTKGTRHCREEAGRGVLIYGSLCPFGHEPRTRKYKGSNFSQNKHINKKDNENNHCLSLLCCEKNVGPTEFIPRWCLHFPTGPCLQLTQKNANNRQSLLIVNYVLGPRKTITLKPPKKYVSACGVNILLFFYFLQMCKCTWFYYIYFFNNI